MPQPQPAPSARNAAIHAAEARFRGQAADIVSLVLRRAHGGDPVCLKLCLERALPAGRIPPPVALAPDYDPSNLKRVFVKGKSRATGASPPPPAPQPPQPPEGSG